MIKYFCDKCKKDCGKSYYEHQLTFCRFDAEGDVRKSNTDYYGELCIKCANALRTKGGKNEKVQGKNK